MEVFSLNPSTDANVRTAVGAAAAEIALDMKPGKQYRFTADTGCYIRLVKVGEASLVAAKASGSTLCSTGQVLLLAAVPQPTVRQSRLVAVAVAAVLRGAVEGYASVKR